MSAKPSDAAKPTAKRRQYLPAEERRRVILEAAREVFSRSGLKGARTRELAQAAGINQATLFEHFKSKEELFIAAVIEPMQNLMEGATARAQSYAAASSQQDLMSMLQTGIAQHLDSMVDNYPLLIQALFSEPALGESFYRQQIKPMLDVRANIMSDFIRPDMDPELVQLASFGMFFALAMDQAMTGKQRDLQQVAQQFSELIRNGCSPTPADNEPSGEQNT